LGRAVTNITKKGNGQEKEEKRKKAASNYVAMAEVGLEKMCVGAGRITKIPS